MLSKLNKNTGEGRAPKRRWFGFSAGIITVLAMAVGLLVVTSCSASQDSRAAEVVKEDACKDPSSSGALHVSGNKVLTSANKTFTFYGLTTFGGLEDGGTDSVWKAGEASATAQIEAAPHWHANTLRLQVAEENLFNNGVVKDGINRPFLAAICHEVQRGRREGMQVVISDQTEWPDWTESNPTGRTVSFWKVIGPEFGDEPGISYDLYNEPRLFYPKATADYHGHFPKVNADWVWKIWRAGGAAAGQKFVGMQSLVKEVRGTLHLSNLIWLEGPYYDDSLGSAKDYPIKGKGIVFELHHPPLLGAKYWNKFFGYLTSKYPMVDGEWSQYASNHPECRSNAYTEVPTFLKYLRAHGVGMIGWSLQPGAMLADPKHLTPTNVSVARDSHNYKDLLTPSRITKSYACTNNDLGNGAGELLLKYFQRYSSGS